MVMRTLEALLRGIDWFIDWSGQGFKWLGLVFVLTISYDVAMRYVFGMPTKWSYELSYMVGGSMMVLAGAFVMLHDEHVKIDIIYNRLSLRKQLIIDISLCLLFFFPMVAILTKFSFDRAVQAWATGELSNLSYWHPPLAPFRTVVFLGFCLLSVEGVAWFTRKLIHFIKLTTGKGL